MYTTAEEVKYMSVMLSSNVEGLSIDIILKDVHETEILPALGSYHDTLWTAFTTDTLTDQQKELMRLVKAAYVRCAERQASIYLTYRITNAGIGIFQPEGFQVKDDSSLWEFLARRAADAVDAVRRKVSEITGDGCKTSRTMVPFVLR